MLAAFTILYRDTTKKLDNKSYFEAGRRPRNRSLLGVNEDFEGEPDAERALLDSFTIKVKRESATPFYFYNHYLFHLFKILGGDMRNLAVAHHD